MQNSPRNLLFMGIALVVIGVVMHLFYLDLSDFILGIGLLMALSAAFLYTFSPGEEQEDHRES